jgi:hypothetical protein
MLILRFFRRPVLAVPAHGGRHGERKPALDQ